MMKYIFSLFFLASFVVNAQHTISGTFSPPQNLTQIFLYQSTPTSSSYVEKGKLEADNSFSIALDPTATQGIYKIVYGMPPEDFNFDVLYNGKENITFLLEDGKLTFEESRQNIAWNDYLKNSTRVINSLNAFYSEGNTDTETYLDIAQELKQVQESYETQYKEDFVFAFIKANRPYIPTEYESIGTYFNHVRETYLKPIDFHNEALQSSDFLTEKVLVYIFDLVSNPTLETKNKCTKPLY